MNCNQSPLIHFAFTSFSQHPGHFLAQISLLSCSLLSRFFVDVPVTHLHGEHPGPCLLPFLHEPFHSSSHSVFSLFFVPNFTPNRDFYCIFPTPPCLTPHLQVFVMALSLQDEDSILQLLHSSLEEVVLLHHGTEAMLQLPLPVCQHFDLQGKERPCQTLQGPEKRGTTFQREK